MTKNETRLYSRRALLLYGLLFFLIGTGVGGVLGIYSLRYILFHRPPPTAEEMTGMVMDRISRDFSLDPSQRERIEAELHSLHKDILGTVDAGKKEIDQLIETRADTISRYFPDDAARNKWRTGYQKYFPRPPSPPGPP